MPRGVSRAVSGSAQRREHHTPTHDISRGAEFHQPLLAQDYGQDFCGHLSRKRLRPRDDDSLFHGPLCPGGLWPAPLLAGLRLFCLCEECSPTPARGQGMAARHDSAPDIQRALRDRAARRSRLAFRLPRRAPDVQVLDDSTDETQQVARACVERHAAQGTPITYIHRTNREGYKAGALENGLKTAVGEFVAIFDADFLPEPDFLRRTIPYFKNPDGGEKIGMVQTRWTYLNSDYSLLTNVETILLDGHFVVEHGARSRRGTFFNFNGTAGVWRRQAVEDAGGWEHDTLTEDTDLSYRSQLKGWKFLYLPHIECASELPVDMNGFKAQQARWAKGLMQTAKKILPKVLRSDAPWHVKAEAFFHLTGNISYPLMILLSTMLLPAMIVRFYQGWFQMLVIDLPLFLASTCSISSFYLVAQRELRPKTWWRTFLYLPFVMATGIGIAVRNAQAVIEALLGKKSEFARTPKFNIEGKQGTFAKKSYKTKRAGCPTRRCCL